MVRDEDLFVFTSLDEILDSEFSGVLNLDVLELGTPWPVVPGLQCDSMGNYLCRTNIWGYKTTPEYLEWVGKLENVRKAKEMRKVAKARYRLLVRNLFRDKIALLKWKLCTKMEYSFLRLVLSFVSLVGWKETTMSNSLAGLICLGFSMGVS